MRYPISSLTTALALVLVACSDGTGVSGGTTTTVVAPTTSADPSGNGSRVQGEVTRPEEAFCVGLVFALPDSPGVLVPEMEDLRQTTYETCMAERYGESISPAIPVSAGFVIGCAFVVDQYEISRAAPEDLRSELSVATCGAYIDRTHPDNFGMEIVITKEGLCYPGHGAGAVLPGCLDEEGNYVTTTTISFTGDAGRNSAILEAARGAFGDTLGGIGGESEVLEYASRVCRLYESGYGYEFIYEVADLRDNAVAWPGVAAEDLARFKSSAWDFTDEVIAELCPEHSNTAAEDRGEFAETQWQPLVNAFEGRLRYAFDGQETHPSGRHHYAVYSDLGLDFWVDFGLDTCRDLDRGSGYGSIRDGVVSVLRSDGSGESEADAFYGYQMAVAITYYLCPRHYTGFHDFEQP